MDLICKGSEFQAEGPLIDLLLCWLVLC